MSIIHAIKVYSDKPAEVVAIDNGLESLQSAVGGYIECLYPFDDEVALICNEEGKLMNLALNKPLYDEDGNIYDIIAGDFLVVYAPSDSEDFEDMPQSLLDKYLDTYALPVGFAKDSHGNIIDYQKL